MIISKNSYLKLETFEIYSENNEERRFREFNNHMIYSTKGGRAKQNTLSYVFE